MAINVVRTTIFKKVYIFISCSATLSNISVPSSNATFEKETGTITTASFDYTAKFPAANLITSF